MIDEFHAPNCIVLCNSVIFFIHSVNDYRPTLYEKINMRHFKYYHTQIPLLLTINRIKILKADK